MAKLCKAVAIIGLFTSLTPQVIAQWAPLATDANAQKRIEWWWREARVGYSCTRVCIQFGVELLR